MFEDASKNAYILVANRDHEQSRVAELHFTTPVAAAKALDRKNGNWLQLELVSDGDGRTVRFSLAPGDGALLRVE